MDCCKNKKDKPKVIFDKPKVIFDKRIDKLVLLIEDLNKQQKQIMEYIEKIEKVIETQKK